MEMDSMSVKPLPYYPAAARYQLDDKFAVRYESREYKQEDALESVWEDETAKFSTYGRQIYTDVLQDDEMYNYRDSSTTDASSVYSRTSSDTISAQDPSVSPNMDEDVPSLATMRYNRELARSKLTKDYFNKPLPRREFNTVPVQGYEVELYGKKLPKLPSEEPYLNKMLPFGFAPIVNGTLKSVQLGSRGFFYMKRRVGNQDTKPDRTKRYPIHPKLKNRIFDPSLNKTLQQAMPYQDLIKEDLARADPPPLYIDIHGGAWVTCDPSFDDKINKEIAHDWECLVISLDYTKALEALFPTPVNQIVDLILEVLKDTSLIFDRKRVCLGGYSAGANIALGAAQDARLKGKICALMPFYPITDFSQDPKVRAGTRPYQKSSDVDLLLKAGPLTIQFFNYVYCQGGADLRDPRLSPSFANRTDLPEWIFASGAEYDILCNEAGAMMGRLANKPLRMVGGYYKGKKTGLTEGLELSDRWGFEAEDGRLKWHVFRGIEHGWTHSLPLKYGEAEVVRQDRAAAVFNMAGRWLWAGPWRARDV